VHVGRSCRFRSFAHSARSSTPLTKLECVALCEEQRQSSCHRRVLSVGPRVTGRAIADMSCTHATLPRCGEGKSCRFIVLIVRDHARPSGSYLCHRESHIGGDANAQPSFILLQPSMSQRLPTTELESVSRRLHANELESVDVGVAATARDRTRFCRRRSRGDCTRPNSNL
jgi:hypothetical protein